LEEMLRLDSPAPTRSLRVVGRGWGWGENSASTDADPQKEPPTPAR
jgi:hypothetical protein